MSTKVQSTHTESPAASASHQPQQRRDPALQPPPDHAGSRHGRSAQAEERQGAADRHRRTRRAARLVSRRGRRRQTRPRRFRRRRFHQSAAPDHVRHQRRRQAQERRRRERALRDLNPDIQIEAYETQLTSDNALELFKDYDIIVDGTDNFPTRYLVNDACMLLGKPNVYGSIFRFEGQATVFGMPDGPCYRCLYPEPPPPGLVPSCAEGGVLGVLPGIVGSIQAMETIKLILGNGDSLVGRLLLFDALGMRFRELKLRKNPELPDVRRASHDQQADRLLPSSAEFAAKKRRLPTAGSGNHAEAN